MGEPDTPQRIALSPQQNHPIIQRGSQPLLGTLAAVVGFFGVGFLHASVIGPFAEHHMFDKVGGVLSATDCMIGFALVFFGIWLVVRTGFNIKSALVLSIGLSMLAFWVLQMLSMLG